ncbi:hypothetical protein DKX38_022431 [Salix brachista]|uniref:Uncharacterized protein n=1 Tax=Salix brachista TaxID=2182728 RepID=A0A5N5K076_9ROSI|nr:hypothetical protein DKX38_022431 [Salix brachista]
MNEREETRNSGRAREGPKIPLISCQEFRPLVTVGPYEYGPAGRRYTTSDKMKMACQFVQDSVISVKILCNKVADVASEARKFYDELSTGHCGVQTSVVVIENRVKKQLMSIINKLMWMACTLVSVALLTLSYIVVGENEKWLAVGVTIIRANIMVTTLATMCYWVVKHQIESSSMRSIRRSSLGSRATKGVMADQYCAPDGWMQLDEGELQHRRNFIERNATWEMTQLSCPSPTHLINTISSTTTTSMSKKAAAAAVRSMDPTMLIKAHDLNVFIAPYRENGHHGALINHFNGSLINGGGDESRGGTGESHQTLQLFPLQSGGDGNNDIENINRRETELSVSAAEAFNANNFSPYQFFEFLPLKN